jgi:hypothetical protein
VGKKIAMDAEREKVWFASGGIERAGWHYAGSNGGCALMAAGVRGDPIGRPTGSASQRAVVLLITRPVPSRRGRSLTMAITTDAADEPGHFASPASGRSQAQHRLALPADWVHWRWRRA